MRSTEGWPLAGGLGPTLNTESPVQLSICASELKLSVSTTAAEQLGAQAAPAIRVTAPNSIRNFMKSLRYWGRRRRYAERSPNGTPQSPIRSVGAAYRC